MITTSSIIIDHSSSEMPISEYDNIVINTFLDINKLQSLSFIDSPQGHSTPDPFKIPKITSNQNLAPIFAISRAEKVPALNLSTTSLNLVQESTNDSNEAMHSKDEIGNMIVKIRGKFHSFLRRALNECIKKMYGKAKYKLYAIAGSFAKKLKNKDNVNLFDKPISCLFTHFTGKEKKNEEKKISKNIKTIKNLEKQREFENIFKMTYVESFNKLFKNTNDLEIKKEFGLFADVFINNRNSIYKELKDNSESKDKADKVYVQKIFKMINNFNFSPKQSRKAKFVIRKINMH